MGHSGGGWHRRAAVRAYGAASGVSAVAALLTWACAPLLQNTRFAFFLGALVINAFSFGIGPSVLTAVISVVCVAAVFAPLGVLFSPGGSGVGAIVIFIGLASLISGMAERRRNAQAQAQRAAERTALLQRITAAFGAARTPEEIARVLVEESLAPLGAALGALRVLTPDGAALVSLYSSDPERLPQRAPLPVARRLPLTDAVRTGEAVWIESREEGLALYPDLVRLPEADGYEAAAALPAAIDGEVLGVVVFGYAAPQHFTDETRSLLLTVAQQCAQALQRARLFAAEQAAREVAEQALRQRDHFLSMAAHELRTPLTSLLANAQLLQRRLGRDENVAPRDQRASRVITEQAVRLNTLISALLDISRLELGQLQIDAQPLDLRAVLRRTVEEIRVSAGERRIELECPDGPVEIVGDELRLGQAFANLIQNACKYSPDRTPVRVALGVTPAEAAVVVADQGIGIAADQLPHLFDRYYRAGSTALSEVSGMGIGLYVVREVVARHGGRVEVQSEPGEGSVFTVTLPRPGPAACDGR